MKPLLEVCRDNLASRLSCRPGDSFLIAVSGGLDSMTLLRLLVEVRAEFSLQLTVAHYNHHLRGRESDRDARLVAKSARQLGLPFLSGEGDVRSFARKKKISVEMAARTLRHRFLAQSAFEAGCRRVALAHHADDQVELFFIRLARGAGPEGLAGMAWASPSPADARVELARPLLNVWRSDLAEYARQTGLEFREDRTNESPLFTRNKIRRRVLPFLEKNLGREIKEHVWRAMEILQAENACLRQVMSALASGESPSKPLKEDSEPAWRRRQLHQELLRKKINPDYNLIEHLRLHPNVPIAAASNRRIQSTVRGAVQELSGNETGSTKQARPATLDLHAGQEACFAGRRFAWTIRPVAKPLGRIASIPGQEQFDFEAVGRRIQLRHWRPGDRFHPIGMPGPAKLQDLLVNAKIPRPERHRLVVAVAQNGEIFWVEGLRISEGAKVRRQTKRVLHWKWSEGS